MAAIALKGVHPNMAAFLLMIQHSEGTDKYANPYGTIVGGSQFTDYSKHPNKLIKVNNNGLYSTAAGAYQFLKKTWDSLLLPDMTPENQDRGCILLIKRRGAFDDVIKGYIKTAIVKCRKEWASLPGAGYGQGERTLISLLAFYAKILPVGGLLLSTANIANFAAKKKL